MNLASVSALFSNGPSVFLNDGIDGYSTGVLPTSSTFPRDPDGNPSTLTGFPWSGADNPTHFFTPQDLFNENNTSPCSPSKPNVTQRLLMAGTNIDSYNRYTFYRLLSQLGTESAPEPPGKLNLNYCNVDNNGNVVPDMATNFIPWCRSSSSRTPPSACWPTRASRRERASPTSFMWITAA